MVKILLTFLIVYFLISLLICLITHDLKLHLFFPIHFSLALITLYICAKWFLTGTEFVFNYGSLWICIQRGSLKALSETMSIVGVGSVLLAWTYGERDKCTLGKRQIDMVHHIFGHGYTVSLMSHIGSSVLCLMMLKSSASEASLWSFITVLWGCVTQATICLFITLNRKERERLALELWERDRRERDTFQVIRDMARYLNDADVRNNIEYRSMIGRIIYFWLYNAYDKTSQDYGITVEKVKTASRIYREIAESVPALDRDIFEEDILQVVCTQLGIIEPKRSFALVLLCFGYYRFLYAEQPEVRARRIYRIVFFSKTRDLELRQFGELLQECHHAMEWYQFLNQCEGLPEYRVTAPRRDAYVRNAFQHLILSFFEESSPDIQRTAMLAWDQAHPEVN